MHTLTPKQEQMLDHLKEFIGEHGYSPTLKQIGRRIGLRSLSTVHKHVAALQKTGLLTKEKNKRGFRLTDKARGIRSRSVPVTGAVAPDGRLRENTDGPSSIETPAALAESDRSFALRIVGDPLPGSGLADGDFLIARQSDTTDSHWLLIAEIDGAIRLTNLTTARIADATVRAVATGMLRVYGPKGS